MIPGLRARLGEATERIYLRLMGIADQAEGEARRAMCRIALDAACGAYHDFRSFRPAPKGALVDDLRAVPIAELVFVTPREWSDGLQVCDRHVETITGCAAEQIAAVVKEIIAGWYDDGEEEARRWVQEVAPERGHPARGAANRQPAVAPELSQSEARVLEFVRRRYADERRFVTGPEVGAGAGMNPINSNTALRRLVKKGAVIDMGKGAGYLPAYAP